jgi:hypothetical protein
MPEEDLTRYGMKPDLLTQRAAGPLHNNRYAMVPQPFQR